MCVRVHGSSSVARILILFFFDDDDGKRACLLCTPRIPRVFRHRGAIAANLRRK